MSAHFLVIDSASGKILSRGARSNPADVPTAKPGQTVELIAPDDPRRPPRMPLRPIYRRNIEYPSIQDQLDMIWKALAQLKGKPWPADVQDMIDRMAAVDAKYPKR